VWPSFPPSFWDFEGVPGDYSRAGHDAAPGPDHRRGPLSGDLEVRLKDHAFEELLDEDFAWADLVMVSAMHAQHADALATLGPRSRYG